MTSANTDAAIVIVIDRSRAEDAVAGFVRREGGVVDPEGAVVSRETTEAHVLTQLIERGPGSARLACYPRTTPAADSCGAEYPARKVRNAATPLTSTAKYHAVSHVKQPEECSQWTRDGVFGVACTINVRERKTPALFHVKQSRSE